MEREPSAVSGMHQNLYAARPDLGGAVTPRGEPICSCSNIGKFFGSLRALANVSLDIYPGEVLALVGDNGAGKTTFTKILSGSERPDTGSISIDGQRLRYLTPPMARQYGIGTVPQDLALCDNLSATMNVVIGHPPLTRFRIGKFGIVDRRRSEAIAREHISAVGVNLSDYYAPIRQLSGGQRQAVAIGRILTGFSRLVIFDEPTAALGVRQRRSTLRIIKDTAQSGIATIIVSHNLEEVLSIADRVVAFWLGAVVIDKRVTDTTIEEVHRAMEGVVIG
jgi:ABC-type sugar transport system ATPase subunit